jgi:hypothetical protein
MRHIRRDASSLSQTLCSWATSSPLQPCCLAEVGERRPWNVERGSVPEEEIQDEDLRVDG